MDRIEDYDNDNNKSHFLKRIVQFLVTISLFSLFLCFSSGFSLFPSSFYLYFSTCLFSFLTRKLERTYMFLICNGILAFLAKSSVSCSSSSSLCDQNFHLLVVKPTILVAQEEKEHEVEEETLSTEKEEVEEEEQGVEEETLSRQKGEEEEEQQGVEEETLSREKGENEDSVAENEGNEEESGRVLVKQDQEYDRVEDEANEELVSTEELNRRIEDFIRKMKEEIRIEAQIPLIAV